MRLLPLLLTALLLTGCSTDLVAPEDERCTVYVVDIGEAYEITRWQMENCEAIRVLVWRTQTRP